MSHRERRPKRRRLTREESRRALLDEGLRMVDEHPVGPGLDHIHPATVAANLGLTSGAVYHHWESYDDFRDELLKELVKHVRNEIGPNATPDVIQWAPSLPKTRSGKIMRRILRKIAAGEYQDLGDTSTLADPSVVAEIIETRKRKAGEG